MERYDSIIIGAGHNGLACALVLARSGHRVLVLEKNHYAGGMGGTLSLDGNDVSMGGDFFGSERIVLPPP